jgi:hypothetical protein
MARNDEPELPTGEFLNRDRISKSVFIALWTTMMHQHRSEYFAILSQTVHPALFSITDRLRCPEQRYCDGLILFGCVAVAERTIVAVYPESSLDYDSPRTRGLQLEGSTAKNITPLAERHKWDSLLSAMSAPADPQLSSVESEI